jgi:hypothetical protein
VVDVERWFEPAREMSAIIELMSFLEDQWAVLVYIFGISLAAVKFWLRDAESEAIRTRFMHVWDYLDNARRYSLYQLRTHRVARRLLTAAAVFVLLTSNLSLLFTEVEELTLISSTSSSTIHYSL